MRRITPLVTALALCCACTRSSADVAPAAEATGSGWRTFAARGVSIDVPALWHATRDAATGRLELTGSEDERALVWAVFVPGDLNAARAASLARVLLERAWPDEDLDELEVTRRPASVLLRIDDEDEPLSAVLGWTATPKGAAAVLYAVSAPAESYAAFAADARRAFASFRVRGEGSPAEKAPADAAAAGARITWTRFVDPRERAFSVDAPQGWRTSGGLFRASAVDVRWSVETQSPDGAIVVRLGEPSVGTFVTGAIGFAEGAVFSPGYGQQMTVRRYVPPAEFALEIARQRGACPDLVVSSLHPRADLTAEMNALYQRHGLAMRLDAGEAAFTCGGAERDVGYALAVLQVVQMGGPAMWKPEYLLGFVAREGREQDARQIAAHMIASLQIDAEWFQLQSGQARSVSTLVAQTGEAIARAANGGYWERTKHERAPSVARSNAMLGIEQVEDENGTRYDVAAGSNHYWISPQGTIVGTEVDAVPHVDFSALQIVPPGR